MSTSDVRAGLDIVVIEDNEDACEGLQSWLESLGHRRRSAGTGPLGLALVLGNVSRDPVVTRGA